MTCEHGCTSASYAMLIEKETALMNHELGLYDTTISIGIWDKGVRLAFAEFSFDEILEIVKQAEARSATGGK